MARRSPAGPARSSALLAGDEGEATAPGAREQAARAAAEAAALGRLDARYEPLAGRLAGLAAELEDVAFETRSMADGVEHDATALAAMEERLSFLFTLERKYGTDSEGLVERAERAADEVGRLRGLEAEGTRRARDATRLLEAVAAAAEVLSTRRRVAAADLGARVERVLGDLGLGGTGVEIAVGRRPAGREEPAVEVGGDAVAFDAAGIDVVVFRIAPNPGEPARPLAKIASGGELSRIALAIEEVLVDADATPTLVFDEIDAGIGGRSADPVGRTLWVLGGRHQVLCVTHLPQIAAHADAHFAIHKVQRDGRTVTEVRRLDDAERVGELAAMLGGGAGDPAAEAVGPRAAGAGGPLPVQPRRPSARPMTGAAGPRVRRRRGAGRGDVPVPADLAAATESFLVHLRIERGLSPATIASYGTDLADFGRSPEAPRWGRSPEAAIDYLARLAGAAGPSGRVLRATSLRRRTAALRSFFRFALAEDLIAVDVAGHLDLPREPRILPDPLTVDEVDRLLRAVDPDLAAGVGEGPGRRRGSPAPLAALRDRALLELLYAAGLRITEALRLDGDDLDLEGGSVRVVGKGDRERVVPVGDVAIDWLGRYLATSRPVLAAADRSRGGARGPRLPVGSRAAPRPQPRLVRGEARGGRRRPGRPDLAAHPAPLVCDAPPGGRSGPARRTGVARPCQYLHDADLHAPDGRTDP